MPCFFNFFKWAWQIENLINTMTLNFCIWKISMVKLTFFVRHDNFSQINTTKLNINNRMATKQIKETLRGMATT